MLGALGCVLLLFGFLSIVAISIVGIIALLDARSETQFKVLVFMALVFTPVGAWLVNKYPPPAPPQSNQVEAR